MEKVGKWIWLLCLLLAFSGCSQKHDHKGKTPLVEVGGKFLYQEDLQAALPLNLSTDDSVLFAESYIRNWVEDALLFEKAEDNIRDGEKVKALVESYRKALVMHAYQEELVKQQLAEDITQEEIADYYEKNKSLFVLEKPMVKGLFIKVPLKSSGLADVRRWYKKNAQDAIEKLEKYSLRNAVTYDYFYDQWRPLEEVEAMIPAKSWTSESNYLKQNRNVELKDTTFHYFLHIEEYLSKGEQKPLDFAQEEIKEILINLKRVDFVNRVKEDLYRQASDKNGIIYYYLESDE
ncbi:MAG: peptidyl-prolyl cis-trans isomerase [Bacteroidaceae bacterium]|nr:peptidyl-prolyl cis-trans isomerase [Bacteroidaceae bacterium]